ncbi:peptide/nickel transport system permease protein [Scopulibacillus darangshiensis]|uniref:Peptide/nickel transport system permease protein n=1 Tax=Scopulibacillus darangshiensis TaxID=442528 RepID=A0A4R2PCW2_9BACL|nr:ABC transporter permease subunit [Scopulibacillus darangshiensis]TCP32234.1 peptide/nickel transport system permease protein [Scopulibacillus darangshiensis]
MVQSVTRLSLKFVLICIGLLLIGSVPSLFDGMTPDFPVYFQSIVQVLKDLFHPFSLTYNLVGTERPLLPALYEGWKTSMLLLLPSFIIALAISLILTYLTMLLPNKIRRSIKFVLFVLESMPDVLVIGIFQLTVIWIYQKTGVLFFNIASFGEENAIGLPIIALTLLPIVLFYRMMVLDAENEATKPYVELAQSKGLQRHKILIVHISRNALISIFSHSKLSLWFMLSNLLVVEFLFNIEGILNFLMDNTEALFFTMGLFMLFLPIFLIFSIGELLIEWFTRQKVDF